MQEGDQVLVKSTDGSPDMEGTVTRVWGEDFVRVVVARTSPLDDLVHHDHIDVPVAAPVDGYLLYAVPSAELAAVPTPPAPVPVEDPVEPQEGGE